MKLFDRSRVTTDWRCRRRRYYNYEHNGTGIVSGSAAYELFFGTVIHDALSTIANFYIRDNGVVPIDEICRSVHTQMHDTLIEQLGDLEYAREQAFLASNMVRGFYNYQWPKILALYPEIVVVEQEVVDDNGFMTKPDLVVRSDEGTLVYIEYKTTSSVADKWQNSWALNPQLHSYMRSIQRKLELDLNVAQIVGLYKGYVDKSGRQHSPFCYAYHRPAKPPFTEAETTYEWKAGLKKRPVWEIDDLSPSEWVDGMPEDVLAEQFVMVPPIYLNENVADTFFRQALLREGEINIAMKMLSQAKDDPASTQGILDAFFAQNLEGCTPSFGSGCPYVMVCHGGVSPDDAMWQARQPHHLPEIEAQKEKA